MAFGYVTELFIYVCISLIKLRDLVECSKWPPKKSLCCPVAVTGQSLSVVRQCTFMY